MLKYENHCCGCATPGYPCLGSSCSKRRVPIYYCDKCDTKCNNPLEEVFEVDGMELCEDCLKNMFKKETEED